ncbi:MAG TPA: hypothetical protein VIO81_02890 [Methyloversatilis sp.]
MKKILLSAALALSAVPALAADVGVSISIGQPGFYGNIDIGDFPRPRLIYPQPVLIVPGVSYPPVYMHVPPGHAKNWRRYCGRYDACGRPVYFVQDRWYNEVYVPRYREREHYRDDRRDHDDRGGYRGGDHDDRGGYGGGGRGDGGSRGNGPGRGHGNGHGHGHGRD